MTYEKVLVFVEEITFHKIFHHPIEEVENIFVNFFEGLYTTAYLPSIFSLKLVKKLRWCFGF